MSTLTTGLAGQQQLRSARRGGPDQVAWLTAASRSALALRGRNFIVVPPVLGGASRRRVGSDRPRAPGGGLTGVFAEAWGAAGRMQ